MTAAFHGPMASSSSFCSPRRGVAPRFSSALLPTGHKTWVSPGQVSKTRDWEFCCCSPNSCSHTLRVDEEDGGDDGEGRKGPVS